MKRGAILAALLGRLLVLAAAAGLVAVAAAASKIVVDFRASAPAHVVARPTTELERRVVDGLTQYLGKVLRVPPKVVSQLDAVPAGAAALVLASGSSEWLSSGLTPPESSPEAFVLETREVDGRSLVIGVGRTDRGMKRAVQRLVIRSEQHAAGWRLPALRVTEAPWIPRREWSPPSWSPEFVRGVWTNPFADKRNNIWLFGDEQIARYVEMLDWLGYSGGQLHDSAVGYSLLGSVDAWQSRLKTFAKALRANGGDVSLWVWAAQFNGYGWVDHDVTYVPGAGQTAFTDPRVRASFERYYDGYAKLAGDVDLLIAHFYDPGSLKSRAEVFDYMRLLVGKFRAANPRVQLGIDFCYAGAEAEYMQQLVVNGFKDVLFLENTMPHTYPPGRREALHEAAKRHGLQMGVWGWHTAETEADQNPNMHVNAKLLSHFYRQIRDGVHRIHPITYWSEMESYHLNNVFSHYAAAQLLWNPERDPDELLREIAEGIWGPQNGQAVLAALHLIQDVRTGPTWETYWVHLPTYRIGTTDAAEDARRAEEALAKLTPGGRPLKPDAGYVTKFPLPFPPETFVELMLPHLRQIRHFAEFRVAFAQLEVAAKAGMAKDELARKANALWNPVREYTNWIGMFGVREAAVQETMLTTFGREQGIAVNPPRWMEWRDANRQLQAIQNRQRTSAEPLRFKGDAPFLWREFFWPLEKGRDRLRLLADNGVVERVGDDLYQLANWEEFRRW